MPRPAPTVRILPTVKPSLRVRRPPRAAVEILARPEAELRQRIREIENSDLFRELVKQGIIARRGLRGRIPQGAYEEHMDAELVEFVRAHDLDRYPRWRDDLLQPDALSRLNALGDKYGVAPAELARFVRYLRTLDGPRAGPGRLAEPGTEAAARDLGDYVPATDGVDVSGAAEVAQRFVARFGLTQRDFIADFLHGDDAAEELAARYDAPVAAVRGVLAAIDDIRIADVAAQALTPSPPASAAGAEEEVRIIADVIVPAEDAPAQLAFDQRAGYGLHYRISPAELDPEVLGASVEEVESLLDELRWINQRRSLVCRVAALLCDYQRRFLHSGDYLDLKPIAQAAVARQLGEPQSNISRGIRDKYVRASHGTYELQFLCQRKADVIARLAQANPRLSDRQLQALLRTRYDCEISRRTVNYHRLRAQRRRSEQAH